MTDKKSLLMIIDILNEYTDSEHFLTCSELINKINGKYDTKLNRKIIYRDINQLLSLGYDISTYKDNGKGYCLLSRDFDESQILLLCNVVHASNFIPKSSSNELIDKLLKTQSKYVRDNYKNMVYFENSKKKENKEFFLNIETIAEAIKEHKTISFNYTEYNFNKEIVTKNSKPYTVSPYYMISDGSLMFLVAKFHKNIAFTHFRLDRIKNIKFSKQKYEELKGIKDPYEYARNKIYMYSGDETNIKIKCKNSALDSLIDIFGKNINIIERTKDYFITVIKTTELGMYHLALHYMDSIEVLSPIELRKIVGDSLKAACNRYK